MTLVKALMPFFIMGKVLGFVPHTITSSGIASSSLSKFTCFLYLIGYCCLLYPTIVGVLHGAEIDINFYNEVIISRYVADFVPVIMDLVASTFTQDKFLSIIDHIRQFDINMSERGHPRRDPVAKYWLYFAVITTDCIISTWINYIVWGRYVAWYEMTYVSTTFIALLYGAHRFGAMAILIAHRFEHLNRTILCEMPRVIKMANRNQLKTAYSVEEVWRIHANLMEAAEKFNICFGIQLLLWIAALMINLVTGLYLSASSSHHYVSLTLSLINMIVAICVLNASSHFLSKEANDLGRILQYPKTKYIRQWSSAHDRMLVNAALLQRPLKISAAGFVDLNLSLILSMMTASITYMVIVLTASTKQP